MIHKEQFQLSADAAAKTIGGYASHVGKIGEDTFVYSVLTGNSADFNHQNQTVITVHDNETNVHTGKDAQRILSEMTAREFSTGRAIFKKYLTLVKNKSFIIGQGLTYATEIVNALETKAVKPSILYQYLETAEHNHKKIQIDQSNIRLI